MRTYESSNSIKTEHPYERQGTYRLWEQDRHGPAKSFRVLGGLRWIWTARTGEWRS